MEKSNWIPITALIAAVIVPFANSLFQDWLKKRSERIASENPALAQPNAITHAGSFPAGASRFITRKGRWFIILVQVLAGAIALMLIQALWPATTVGKWFSLVLAALLFVCVQALPWVTKRLPQARPDPPMIKQFGLLWDNSQNPHCPVDETPLFVVEQRDDPVHGLYDKLKCPKCKSTFPIRSDNFGLMTLTFAKSHIQEALRSGRISN